MVDKKSGDGRERVALDAVVVQRVRKNKTKTGIPINVFFEKAATEKLDKQDARDSEKVGGKK